MPWKASSVMGAPSLCRPASGWGGHDRGLPGVRHLPRDRLQDFRPLHRKKINVSAVLAGQKLGIKEVDDGIWLVSFMHY